MRPMRAWKWLLAAALSAACGSGGFAIGCGMENSAPVATDTASTSVPHGDHSPHHGGVVMMKGDLHYEVVLDPAGRYRLYFSDATRADLPAAAAANASIIVTRPGDKPEGVELRIDETGESWIGEGRPVNEPSKTTTRISFTVRGEEPYWIDLPFDTRVGAEPHR